jgi:tetrapyrrole methylase family protein/MazG family protein
LVAESLPGDLTIVGLGPGSLERLPSSTRTLLLDPEAILIVRTLEHPAAAELAALRVVQTCDDLYQHETFEEVYDAITDRVVEATRRGRTIYAVPGSALVGELAVARIRDRVDAVMVAGESFIDAVLAAVGYDPLDRGLRVLNGHGLPYPLVIDGPTIVAHLDLPVVLADVGSRLSRVVAEGTVATIVIDAGGANEVIVQTPIDQVDSSLAGLRTSMFLDPTPGGVVGVIQVMARLREECPWDRKQTHESLVKSLIEETFELVEAIGSGSEGQLEDELGDVFLQVLFHANIARQAGAFDIEDVAEVLRQKLVRRHPHVFGDVDVEDAEEVKANWEQIKEAERGQPRQSLLDGVPVGMPALARAAKIQRRAADAGFDWPEAAPVLDKLFEEVEELRGAVSEMNRVPEELGDVLFTVVNLARHLSVDPELALRAAMERFVSRFQAMEAMGPFEGLTLEELDERWERAKNSRQ